MSLVDRVNRGAQALRNRHEDASRFGLDDLADYFTFGGNSYPLMQTTFGGNVVTTMGSVDKERIGATSSFGYKGNAPIFALVMARMQAFAQVRFQWTRFVGAQPSALFGSPELAVLERPWPGGTTSDLLSRMEIHASLAGCAYVIRPKRDRLTLLRPDRVTIILGSQTDAEDPAEAPDVEVAGFIYTTSRGKIFTFDSTEVAYYAPTPDPDYHFLGMSWITPVIREMQSDSLMTEHKARFMTNAATPNLAIKFDPATSIEQAKQFKALLETEHKGAWNAYKTIYLGGGADPVVIGKDFRQLDFAATQGIGECRLAAAAGVPPSWVGFSEGLKGSSLNKGNYSEARRRFSDGTIYHLWTNAATSLQTLLTPPDAGASLWFDNRVPFMREDASDMAAIQSQQASVIVSLVRDGFTPDSVVTAIAKNDWSLLKHSGLTSVQLQPPASGQEPFEFGSPPSTPPPGGPPNGSPPSGSPNGKTAGVSP